MQARRREGGVVEGRRCWEQDGAWDARGREKFLLKACKGKASTGKTRVGGEGVGRRGRVGHL